MKNSTKVGFSLLALAVLTSPAFASRSIIGAWHGKILFDMTKLTPLHSVADNVKRSNYLNKLQQATISLTLRGDHSYTDIVNGGPTRTERILGKWTLNGRNLTLQPYKDGRTMGESQTYAMDKTMASFSLTKEVKSFGTDVTVRFSR